MDKTGIQIVAIAIGIGVISAILGIWLVWQHIKDNKWLRDNEKCERIGKVR